MLDLCVTPSRPGDGSQKAQRLLARFTEPAEAKLDGPRLPPPHMNNRRFFALLILCVGVLAAVVLAIVANMLFKDATRTRSVDNVANAALGEVENQTAEIGSFDAVGGVAVIRAPLTVRQTYALSSGSKEAGSTLNYLHFDPTSRSAYWLKPSMKGLILNTQQLPESEYGQKKLDTITFVYVCVEHDSNGDNRLTDKDSKSIAISDPTGKNYRIVVEKADHMNEARLIRPDRLLILYSIGTKLATVELNPRQPSAPIDAYDVNTGAK